MHKGGLIRTMSDFSTVKSAFKIYPASLHEENDSCVFIADVGDKDVLVAAGPAAARFKGTALTAGDVPYVCCELEHENADALRKMFPFTAPSKVLHEKRTVGVGDRLGLATPGHIRVFKRFDAFPIFAQQSIRELNLTNRTFGDVMDAATWGVFREGFTRPWGADGDHLKTFDEIEYALKYGYTMITLDCSEHIHNDAAKISDEEVAARYTPHPELEALYMGKTFDVGGHKIVFSEADFKRTVLIYSEAIDYTVEVWNKYFEGKENGPELEMSIDETESVTEPYQHYFVASELLRRGVKLTTLAPRFVGECQKGIDYIGTVESFDADFAVHAAIADKLGYKISVHSGSDKFSVFPSIGRLTGGHFHLKTAGTNWLVAMQIIAEHDPKLYREVHKYALEEAFTEASKYYHVTTDLTKIPALDTLTDEQLPDLFKQNDARQLIHITYGLILTVKNADGTFVFRDRLFSAWRKYAEEYAVRLDEHIGRHLQEVYKGFQN